MSYVQTTITNIGHSNKDKSLNFKFAILELNNGSKIR